MIHPICRGIILRTMYHNGLHPVDYAVEWLGGERESDCDELLHPHGCQILVMRCDNFRFAMKIPQENLIFHGHCDDCRTLFVAERVPLGETWDQFVARLSMKG